ncbi:DUF6882 domain-containing protein [Aliikangiella sp. IMCC44653]
MKEIMDDEEFQKYLDSCFDELEKKQQMLIDDYGFGSFDRFEYDFDKEEIYFLNNAVIEVTAKIIPIGSYNSDSKTWMWAWANEAFPDSLREKSAQLKQLEELTGYEMFGNEMAEIDEDMTWEIAGMSLYLLEYQGVYRGPANNTQYFYALDQVQNVNS